MQAAWFRATQQNGVNLMDNKTATFYELEDLAKFCAELVRQGIAFHVYPSGTGYRVAMTGY
jgi:hypothetical protein